MECNGQNNWSFFRRFIQVDKIVGVYFWSFERK